MRGRAGMAKGVRWLRMVGVDEGMERVGGGVGWSIKGAEHWMSAMDEGVRGL